MAAYIQQSGLDSEVVEPATQKYNNFLFLDSLASDNNLQSCQTDPQPQSPSEPGTSTNCLNENHVNIIFSQEEDGAQSQVVYEEGGAAPVLHDEGDPFPSRLQLFWHCNMTISKVSAILVFNKSSMNKQGTHHASHYKTLIWKYVHADTRCTMQSHQAQVSLTPHTQYNPATF